MKNETSHSITNLPLHIAEEISDFLEKSGIGVFCNGTKADGSEFYAYVLMSVSNFEKYNDAISINQSFNIEDFGQIIAQGDGLTPPDTVKLEMALIYGISHNFEKKIEDFLCLNEELDLSIHDKVPPLPLPQKRILD